MIVYYLSLWIVITLDGACVYDSKPDENIHTLVLTDIDGEEYTHLSMICRLCFFFLKMFNVFIELFMVYTVCYFTGRRSYCTCLTFYKPYYVTEVLSTAMLPRGPVRGIHSLIRSIATGYTENTVPAMIV
jgi:hypothetical protein